jgi:hypothetical protein
MENFRRQRIADFPARLLEKWPPGVLEEGFVPFPKRLLRSAHRIFIGPDAMKELSAVLAIVDFKRPNLTRHPSRDFLAFLAGLPRGEFDKALAQLEAKGLIKTEENGDELKTNLDALMERIQQETPNEHG